MRPRACVSICFLHRRSLKGELSQLGLCSDFIPQVTGHGSLKIGLFFFSSTSVTKILDRNNISWKRLVHVACDFRELIPWLLG